MAATIIDMVSDVVEEQHPEIELRQPHNEDIEEPALITGRPYYDLEDAIADKLLDMVKAMQEAVADVVRNYGQEKE